MGLWLLREAGKRVVFGKLIEVGRVGLGCRCFATKAQRPGAGRPHKAAEGFKLFSLSGRDWYFQHTFKFHQHGIFLSLPSWLEIAIVGSNLAMI